ncbi:MAG: leucyl aminopeptidase [Nocardioidaceae bacterium]
MTAVSLRAARPAAVKADAIVIGVCCDGDALIVAESGRDIARAFAGDFAKTMASLGVSSKPGEATKVPAPDGVQAAVLVLVGLGDSADVDPESLRRAAGAAIRALAGCQTVALALPATTDEQVRALTEGALLGGYEFDRYLSKQHDEVADVLVLTEIARSKPAKEALATATSVAAAVNFARDLVNVAPNDLYPESFAAELKARAKRSRVSVKVTDEKALEAGGYGGILGVGKGSIRSPRLVKLSYQPTRPKAHIALVGKGITFDSGGLSIKTGTGMMTMKCDMAGAAAVAAATFAIADLGLPVRVTAYACLAENMPSGHASRPGDVLTMYGGKTVEVLNTDAEGRLVLADGITTANADKPDLIVDVATLTGACVVALGKNVSGVFSNDDELHKELPRIAQRAGELMWSLPIPEEMKDKVQATKIADLSQVNTEPYGGALFAAAFLREFVADGIRWAHLDIAGPAFNDDSPWGYTPKGGTGASVRTLVQLAAETAAG